jgi:hypothetical protein
MPVKKSYSRIITKRLPSLLLGRVVGPSGCPADKRSTSKSHRRIVDDHTAIWQAVWSGLVASGISQQAGCWEFRKWVTRSGPRGSEWICGRLKAVCVSIRDVSLTHRSVDYVPEFPRKLQMWLRNLARREPKRALAFTRFARALPKPSAEVAKIAMYNHAITLSSGGEADSSTTASLESYARVTFSGQKLRKRTIKSLPSSKNAVRGGPGMKGGYDGYLQLLLTRSLEWPLPTERPGESFPDLPELKAEYARVRELFTRSTSPATDILFGRAYSAMNRYESLYFSTHMVDGLDEETAINRWASQIEAECAEFGQAIGALLTIHELHTQPGDLSSGAPTSVTHKATVIAEQGYKARIITVPPSGVYTLGDMVRQKVWPSIMKGDKRVRPFIESVNDEMLVQDLKGGSLTLGPGEAFLSADLTKATDGFYHNAVQAVLRGLAQAGLGEAWAVIAAESLGVGSMPHCVKYSLGDFPEKHREEMARSFRTVGEAGKESVYVPLKRGILMGTPLSFSILSIINGWACNVLGAKTRICGDDVVACCKPRAITHYAARAGAVGSGLHEQKSFYGTKGFTFCEVFGLGSGPVRFFNPYPLKQFQRDGYGVMDPGKAAKYDVMQWSALNRVCRVLLKTVRARARRLNRPPELTAALGGLGHPSKGMRSIPKPVRAQLRSLVEDPSVNPFKYVTRVDVFFAPADGGLFKTHKDHIYRSFQPPLGWSDEPEDGKVFVSLRRLNADFAVRTHQAYWASGGRYRTCEPKAMKPGKLKLPAPGPEIYGNKTPVGDVVDALARLRDTRGAWLSIEDARKIRGSNVTSHARNDISIGPRYTMQTRAS